MGGRIEELEKTIAELLDEASPPEQNS